MSRKIIGQSDSCLKLSTICMQILCKNEIATPEKSKTQIIKEKLTWCGTSNQRSRFGQLQPNQCPDGFSSGAIDLGHQDRRCT
jgi:hypothetical protein